MSQQRSPWRSGASLVGHVALPDKPRPLQRLLHWADYGEKLTEAARPVGVRTVVTVWRPMTSETIYELPNSGLEVRPYVAPSAAPADRFEMSIPYEPATLGIAAERIEPLGAIDIKIYKAEGGRMPI